MFDGLDGEAFEYGRKSQAADVSEIAGEAVTGSALFQKLKAQGFRCYYTGQKLTRKNISLDHKQPLSKGGKHVMSNIALCLRKVNTMKGQMTEDEFRSICKSIGQCRPDEW